MSEAKWIYIDGIPAQFVRDEVRQQIIFEHYVKVINKHMIEELISLLMRGTSDQLKAFIENVERGK